VKPIKMFGLTALAGLMAMAFVGASSAMAEFPTALCKEDASNFPELVCPAGKLISHVHETTAGTKAVWKTSLLTVECEVLFLGDVLTEGLLSEPPESLLISGNLSYFNCSSGCTFTEENAPAHLEVLKTADELAKVTGEFLLHLSCSGLNCRYNGVGLVWHALGPLLSARLNGDVRLEKQALNKESGTFCPSVTELTIDTTPLELIYIAS
jgi:hypothetical protein